MEKKMTDAEKRTVDSLFEAFSIVSAETYIFICDMKYDISRWSRPAVEFFGLPGEYMEKAGQIWVEYLHPEDRAEFRKSVGRLFAGLERRHDMQYRARSKNGEYVLCTCRGVVINDRDGNPRYFGGAIKNHGLQSNIDEITGLRNYYGFRDDLKSMLDKHQAGTVMMLGIHGFAEFNTLYGYEYGNRVLQSFGRFFRAFMGSDGAVYRMDGSRFALISHTLSIEDLKSSYKKFRKNCRDAFTVDGERQTLTLNAGALSVGTDEKIDAKTVYSCLSYSYGESKDKGRGKLHIFQKTQGSEGVNSLELIHAVRESIGNGFEGFYLCYQPVVSCMDETLVGAEALIRWRSEKYGNVPPNSFIPVLERDPLFNDLGRWILAEAMREGAEFNRLYPGFVMNVNLAYSQLEDPDFVQSVLDLIETTRFPADQLCLEITERCRMADMDLLKSIMIELQGHGVRFALDDFGTGYSSLSIIKNLPVDEVKIDREFVKDLENSEKDRNTVKYTSTLISLYATQICAEGIETEAMRDYLRKYDVTMLQGYLYSKPIEPAEFTQRFLMNRDADGRA